MFYSHQLLSGKVRMAQICFSEEILNPSVPVALILSGIVMGGVAIVYKGNVRIFYDDVTRLLVEINSARKAKEVPEPTLLPETKNQAKEQVVSITNATKGFGPTNFGKGVAVHWFLKPIARYIVSFGIRSRKKRKNAASQGESVHLNELPDELLQNILGKLPVRSRIIASAVSKKWREAVVSSKLTHSEGIWWFSEELAGDQAIWIDRNGDRFRLNWDLLVEDDPIHFESGCQGIFCCKTGLGHAVVISPFHQQVVILPPLHIYVDVQSRITKYGVGIHANTVKVVCVISIRGEDKVITLARVFTIGAQEWRPVPCPNAVICSNAIPVFEQNNIYWNLAESEQLLAFDVNNERFSLLVGPWSGPIIDFLGKMGISDIDDVEGFLPSVEDFFAGEGVEEEEEVEEDTTIRISMSAGHHNDGRINSWTPPIILNIEAPLLNAHLVGYNLDRNMVTCNGNQLSSHNQAREIENLQMPLQIQHVEDPFKFRTYLGGLHTLNNSRKNMNLLTREH